MNIINIALGVDTQQCSSIVLGRRGENEVTQVVVDFSSWAEEFGTGVITLLAMRSQDTSAYPVVLTLDGNTATWDVTSTDTAYKGSGRAEYIYTVGDQIAKSVVFNTVVMQDIGEPSETPPDPYEEWLERLTELGAETQANAQAAEQSAANAAQSAEDAAESAAIIEGDVQQAEEAARQAQAAQTASEAARDAAQTAQASAGASATAASGSAASAASSATAAAGSATDAGASATAASASASTASNAATAAQAAQQSAADSADEAEQAAQAAHIEYEQLADEVADQKSAISEIEDGTGIMVPTGYFPNAWKLIDNAFGEYKYKYIADNNTFIMNRDKSAAGTTSIGIGISDSGLSLADRILPIADFPVVKFHVDCNAPEGTTVQYRVFTYQSNGSTLNHNYYVNVPADGNCTEDIAKKIADNNWRNDVYWAIVQVVADSATYTEAPYLHVTFEGFYTQEQIENWNLVERLENMDNRIDELENMSDHVDALTNALPMYGEKAASGAPVTITRKAGYLTDTGTYYDVNYAVSSVTEKIKCSEGDVFYYYGRCVDSVVTAMWFTSDGSILSTEKIDGGGYATHLFTAPANADSVIFTSFGTASDFTDYSPALVVTQKTTYDSPLSRKIWYPCGDSFTYGEFESGGITDGVFLSGKYSGKNKTYPYHIGNRTNVDVRRGSTSGETIAAYSGGSVIFSNPNYQFGYKSISSDADYITLWFGINDSGRNIPIGTIDDATNTTFYGAWNVVLDDLTTRCTKAHIGIIVSNNLAASYVDAVIAVAKKWGIPYLDLNYDNSVPLMHYSLRPDASAEIKAKRNAQFAISSENHHPNLLAHEYESYFIEKWLLSL